VYFISKGTASFCLSREYGEKEIKEVKKHNNFGEIEMCLGEKIKYNIKIKSRNCELFVLKKNDFLKLSVNFKDFIEKFLYKSLMIYLRFTNEKKRIMKIVEETNGIVIKKSENENNNEPLEMIYEENELELGDSKHEDEINKSKTISSKSSSESSSAKNGGSRNRMRASNISNSRGDNAEDEEKSKKLTQKFFKKVEKILEFIETYKAELPETFNMNTVTLLKKLRSENDLSERDELLDKVEDNLREFLK
jgi:hypothetical protein